jgi:hypothetical protein
MLISLDKDAGFLYKTLDDTVNQSEVIPRKTIEPFVYRTFNKRGEYFRRSTNEFTAELDIDITGLL